jgi:hypothetical protein
MPPSQQAAALSGALRALQARRESARRSNPGRQNALARAMAASRPAADEPQPIPSGIWLSMRNCKRNLTGRPSPPAGRDKSSESGCLLCVRAKSASRPTADRKLVGSLCFHLQDGSSSATAAVSKAAPRLADVAGSCRHSKPAATRLNPPVLNFLQGRQHCVRRGLHFDGIAAQGFDFLQAAARLLPPSAAFRDESRWCSRRLSSVWPVSSSTTVSDGAILPSARPASSDPPG